MVAAAMRPAPTSWRQPTVAATVVSPIVHRHPPRRPSYDEAQDWVPPPPPPPAGATNTEAAPSDAVESPALAPAGGTQSAEWLQRTGLDAYSSPDRAASTRLSRSTRRGRGRRRSRSHSRRSRSRSRSRSRTRSVSRTRRGRTTTRSGSPARRRDVSPELATRVPTYDDRVLTPRDIPAPADGVATTAELAELPHAKELAPLYESVAAVRRRYKYQQPRSARYPSDALLPRHQARRHSPRSSTPQTAQGRQSPVSNPH